MKLTTFLNERQRRLAKWSDKVSPIAEWLSEKEELLAIPLSDSLDHDTARTHKNEFVVRTERERERVVLDVFYVSICAFCYLGNVLSHLKKSKQSMLILDLFT